MKRKYTTKDCRSLKLIAYSEHTGFGFPNEWNIHMLNSERVASLMFCDNEIVLKDPETVKPDIASYIMENLGIKTLHKALFDVNLDEDDVVRYDDYDKTRQISIFVADSHINDLKLKTGLSPKKTLTNMMLSLISHTDELADLISSEIFYDELVFEEILNNVISRIDLEKLIKERCESRFM